MARTPRPVNPDDGPIPSFAHALRELREQAGNPTYRALARTAGFSATTLGEAAGGVRLPSLEVALAYAGACGGDPDEWRARWQEARREAEVLERPAGGGPDAFEDEVSLEAAELLSARRTGAPGERSGGRLPGLLRRRPAVAAIAAACVLAVGAGVIGAFASDDGPAAGAVNAAQTVAPAATLTGCPKQAAQSSIAFTGATYGIGANVRSGASLSAPVRLRVPAGCTIGFSGYCLGDIVHDITSNTPDMRWFIMPGGGEVASAIVHGNPPTTLKPSPCPDDVPGPSSVQLSVTQAAGAGGVDALQATGSQLGIVGFAAFYKADAAGAVAQWHPLGLTAADGNAGFSALLRPALAAAPPAAGIPVVAAACYGGNAPTNVAAAMSVPVAAGSAPAPPAHPTSLGAAQLAAAESVACQYPVTTG